MRSLSFDPVASLYDQTRTFDPGCFSRALDWLVERYPPTGFPRVLEPGIGTGRIAIPLAQRGYEVTGVDVSEEMLSLLDHRLKSTQRPLSVNYLKSDATALRYPAGQFDIGIAVHLFYFIENWKQAMDELLRVVKVGCPIILMGTGFGREVPWLNERYTQLCFELGYVTRHIGAQSTREVVDYASSLGCGIERIDSRFEWIAHIPLAEALSFVRARAYSYTQAVPEAVHTQIVQKLELEAIDRFGSGNVIVEVPNEISMVVITARQPV